MTDIKNIKCVDFTTYICTSDGKPVKDTGRNVAVLFNCTQISEDEVLELVNNGMYEYDARIIVTTPEQVAFLNDKEVTND